MRLAYLINQYPAISHSFIRREIQAIEARGFEVMRISIRGWDLPLADDDDRVERARTRYVLQDGAIPLLLATLRMALRRPLALLRTFAFAWRMSEGSPRPALVHCVYVAEACLIALWLRDAGITHLHAHFGTNSAEVALYTHLLGGPPWSFTVHGPEEYVASRAIHVTEKVHHASAAVAICHSGRASLCSVVPISDWPKIKIIHCGLDPVFLNVPPTEPIARNRLLCVARLSAEKGHAVLLEAAHLLALKGVDFKLVLGGDGSLRPAIEEQIRAYGLADHVKLIGWLSGEQVRSEILASRALVLASFHEGLPVVIMEALALRRPVISTFVAGIPELVKPGDNGWLVPASDAIALAEAMQTCLEAPDDLIRHMGEAGRKRVLSNHDAKTEAEKLLKVFEELDQRARAV
jgi:colanic acid/amylovoran biosynthesis glycosyltransferase